MNLTKLLRMKQISALFMALLITLFVVSCRGGANDSGSGASSSAGATASSNISGGAIDLVDDAGKKVHLDHPVQRAAVISRYTNELIRAMGSIDKVVAVDLNTAQDTVYWPQFKPNEAFTKSERAINFEQLANKKVDALIMSKGDAADKAEEKGKPLGIKVIRVNGYDHLSLAKEMNILGKAFDNLAGAKKVIDFFNENMKSIADRIKDAPVKSVYWEYGEPYTTAIPKTWNDGWHQMILAAGGKNIFADAPKTAKKVDPEKILTANPDFIFRTVSGKALKNTGIYTPPTKAEFEAIAKELVSRPGWANLKAVKNGNVYIITGFAEGGLDKMVGAVYLAKWMHPEQMKDIDPDVVFSKWMQMQGQKVPAPHTFHVIAPGKK